LKPLELGNRALKRIPLPHQLLGVLGVAPEARVFRFGVQRRETVFGRLPVKETSSGGRTPPRCRRKVFALQRAWRASEPVAPAVSME
jgi:hypothetical protein